MLSITSPPHTTLLRAFWTSARIPRFAAHGLYLTSGTAYSDHSSCGLRAVRPSSLALHFFPHTRPPDIAVRLEYQGSLVNTYSSLDLHSIPRHRPHGKRALALTRSGAGVDLTGVLYTMPGSDDDAPAARGPPLGGRARRSEVRESSRAWCRFPLKHKRMQTVLLVLEIGSLMAWDGDSKNAVNTHFGQVGDISAELLSTWARSPSTTYFGPSLWLPSNPPTTASFAQRTTRSSTTWTTTRTSLVRTSKQSMFSNFGIPRSDIRIHLTAPTPRALCRAPRRSKPSSSTNNQYKRQGGNELAAFLCNTLEKQGEQPGKVLRRAGLAGAEWNEPVSVTALFMAARGLRGGGRGGWCEEWARSG
jgi:hypothetical protein